MPRIANDLIPKIVKLLLPGNPSEGLVYTTTKSLTRCSNDTLKSIHDRLTEGAEAIKKLSSLCPQGNGPMERSPYDETKAYCRVCHPAQFVPCSLCRQPRLYCSC